MTTLGLESSLIFSSVLLPFEKKNLEIHRKAEKLQIKLTCSLHLLFLSFLPTVSLISNCLSLKSNNVSFPFLFFWGGGGWGVAYLALPSSYLTPARLPAGGVSFDRLAKEAISCPQRCRDDAVVNSECAEDCCFVNIA